jgi:hypothetical protein
MMVTTLGLLHPKKVARLFKPSDMNVDTLGILGILVSREVAAC